MGASSNQRIFGLDVMRAIAILLVVFGHGGLVSGNLFESFPVIPLLDGVELFFVLSGLLIGTILIQQLNNEDGFTYKDLFVFWKRRWFRTLPNYYLILLIQVFLVTYGVIGGDSEAINWKFLFFLQNFNEGFVGFFWESWSLAIEEWFYILFPVIAWLTIRLIGIRKGLLISIGFMLIFPLLYRYSISDENVDFFWWDVNFRKVVITRLDAIMFGVLAAYIKYYYFEFWKKCGTISFILGVAIISLILFFPQDPNSLFAKTLYFTFVSLGAMLLLPKLDALKTVSISWLSRSVTYISKISYAMYLVNLGLVAQVIATNWELHSKKEHLLAYCVYWTATICISAFIYHVYELPMTKLRDRR